MLRFGSLSDTQCLFDSGLSSILTNSTNNSITSGSPPNAFTSSYIDRPDTLFSSLYESDGPSNQFSLASSISNSSASNNQKSLAAFLDLDQQQSFGNAGGIQSDLAATLSQLSNLQHHQINNQNQHMERPTSFNTGGVSLFSSTDYGSPLGAPGSQIGVSQMSVGNNLSSPFASTQHTPVATTPTSGNAGPPKNPKLYKTELCRSWMDHGKCNYGERCQYAHGEEEKRPVPRHPKYKTEACQSFHQSGYCPYGPRCHFIHNDAPNASSTPFSSPASTPVTVNGQPSLYASQYHNVTLKAGNNGVPSNVLQRVYSLPGGYGSAGESPAGSSNDSGSESPNGSFSPGLDLDETGPFSAGFLSTSPQKMSQKMTIGQSRQQQQKQQSQQQHQQVTDVPRHQPSRFLSYDQSAFNDSQFSHLLNDICQWNLDDTLGSFSGSGTTSQKWSTDDFSSTQPNNSSSTPGRLPVFAQLSNPQ